MGQCHEQAHSGCSLPEPRSALHQTLLYNLHSRSGVVFKPCSELSAQPPAAAGCLPAVVGNCKCRDHLETKRGSRQEEEVQQLEDAIISPQLAGNRKQVEMAHAAHSHYGRDKQKPKVGGTGRNCLSTGMVENSQSGHLGMRSRHSEHGLAARAGQAHVVLWHNCLRGAR